MDSKHSSRTQSFVSDPVFDFTLHLQSYLKSKADFYLHGWTGTEKLILLAIIVTALIILVATAVEKISRLRRWMTIYELLTRIPIVKGLLKKEFTKSAKDFAKDLPTTGLKITKNMPREGVKVNALVKRLEDLSEFELNVKKQGKYSGSVFSTEQELMDLNGDSSNMFLFADLNKPEFNSMANQLENEIIAMLLSLFKGNSNCSGITTTGGSESLELAILAHRQHYKRKRGVTKAEVIIPETAHAAFYKGAEFLDVKIVPINITKDFRVDLKAIEAAINENTVLIVSSCPNFPYGTCDPLKAMAKLALKYDVGLHMDACMGGFLVPFAKEHGIKLPEENYDFSVKGVTSISTDPHKYGLTAKGIGVLLFGDAEIQKSLYFCKTDGPGQYYQSATVQDTRSAAIIAACWATMMYYGYEGYSKLAKEVFDGSIAFVNKLRKIPGIEVIGNPVLGNIAIISRDKRVDIYNLGNYICEQGWKTACTPKYPCLHLTVHKNNMEYLDQFVESIRKGMEAVANNPKRYLKGPNKIMKDLAMVPSTVSAKAMQFCYHELFDIENLDTEKIQAHQTQQSASHVKNK